MAELLWIAGLALVWYGITVANRYWQRRKEAAKLADSLLEDVLKQKDGFRR